MSTDAPRLAREKKTIAAMVAIYCHAHHGTKGPLCVECRALADYACCRLYRCPYGMEKPSCADCPIHCYKPLMKEQVKVVMRYAGPRMLYKHPILALRHWLDTRRHKPVASSVALGAALVLLALAGGTVRADEIVLADGGKSDYRIVVARDASPSTRYAAEELQTFLEQMADARLAIVSDTEPASDREILLGQSEHLRRLDLKLDVAGLGKEGYILRTAGPRLVIAGSPVRGNLYGVYGLLEDHLGCRWFAPGVSRIPKKSRLAIAALDERRVPALEYRESYLKESFDGDWCARNRMNSSAAGLLEKHGGKVSFGNGFFVHTFNRLVPPKQYFKEHPEYFSLVKGKRLAERSQLCCTNEEVIRICTERVREAMRQQPDATIFSISQNDWFNYCECDKCQAVAKREGSQIAPVLQLVNRAAEAVAAEFPDKAIETLAYQWTRKAPKTLRPRPNVIVRLCSIECCFAHPMATCDSQLNRAFRRDMEDWARVADRLWVWDYVTDFGHYLLPFPNQRARVANVGYFLRHHVTGIFEEDTYDTPQSELAELGQYLTAKALWNPAVDCSATMNEFLEGYYGPAARPIRAYLDLLHDRVESEDIHVTLWVQPHAPYLTEELLAKANDRWAEAEATAAGSPDVLRRVRLARMSVDYAIVERARLLAEKKVPGGAKLQSLAAERFGPFMAILPASGVTRLREGQDLKFPDYRGKLAKTLKLPVGVGVGLPPQRAVTP